jgi:hypothetical protein
MHYSVFLFTILVAVVLMTEAAVMVTMEILADVLLEVLEVVLLWVELGVLVVFYA